MKKRLLLWCFLISCSRYGNFTFCSDGTSITNYSPGYSTVYSPRGREWSATGWGATPRLDELLDPYKGPWPTYNEEESDE